MRRFGEGAEENRGHVFDRIGSCGLEMVEGQKRVGRLQLSSSIPISRLAASASRNHKLRTCRAKGTCPCEHGTALLCGLTRFDLHLPHNPSHRSLSSHGVESAFASGQARLDFGHPR